MNVVIKEYGISFELKENQIYVLVIENQQAFRDILFDLWNEINGNEGNIILSECEKIKNVSKEVECIFNPFALDGNNKRVIHKLYQELKERAESCLQEDTVFIKAHLLNYMEQLLQTVPYSLCVKSELDVADLLKVYGVEILDKKESLLESIVDYLKIMKQICGISIFVFVNLRQYLSEKELDELYEYVFYEKIHLILIEGAYKKRKKCEKCWIIDKDLCIIEMDID